MNKGSDYDTIGAEGDDNMQEIGMADRAYETVKGMILSQQLKPGDRIPEVKLANQLGISRTPMREALKRLASDEIVTIYPNRYAEVTVFPPEWLQEIGMIRITLDMLAAHLCILHGSNFDFSQMEQINEECHQAALEGRVADRIRLNCRFHLEMSRISKNEELFKTQEKLYMKLEYVQACHYGFVNTEENQYNQHKDIIQAFYARDEDKAIDLLVEHDGSFHHMENSPAFLMHLKQTFVPIPKGNAK